MMSEQGSQGRKWPRGASLILTVSLALNLAVAGVFVGSWLSEPKGGGRGGPPVVRELGFGLFNSALSEKDREALMRNYLERAPDLRQARAQMRDDLEALLAAIRAQPFEAGAVKRVLDRSAERAQERRELGESLIVEHLNRLSPQERDAFAHRLDVESRQRPHNGRGPERDRDGDRSRGDGEGKGGPRP